MTIVSPEGYIVEDTNVNRHPVVGGRLEYTSASHLSVRRRRDANPSVCDGKRGLHRSPSRPPPQGTGHVVSGCDLGLYEGWCQWSRAAQPDTLLRRDVRSLKERDLAGHDCVMHLAANSNDPMGELDVDLTKSVNGEASVRLARVAKRVAGSHRSTWLAPAGYVETQGAFARHFAEVMAPRLGVDCPLDLATHRSSRNPRVPIGLDAVEHLVPQWDEDAAWDELATYYRAHTRAIA